jgi:SAM-dependent methyltransferase
MNHNLIQLPLSLGCPKCHSALEALSNDEMRCPEDGLCYRCVEGIWRFLLPERQAYFEKFVEEYETVRAAERRGSDDAAYYRGLPFTDLSGRRIAEWRIRATSFRAILTELVIPLEKRRTRQLKILDLGAGNGWLSNQLSQRGHILAAVDLQTNSQDGLGALKYYEGSILSLQAEFEHLPLTCGQIDVAIFNASFHYATRYFDTLREILRILTPGGLVAILDTPVYRDSESGRQMVQERQAQFTRLYGFPSDSIPSENYLTEERLAELGRELDLDWHVHTPWYGMRWAVRPYLGKLRGQREPARFMVISAERKN